ncbi:Cytochrome c556 [Cognatiyoonia koreensis]|uniref:Cytochrome c556 n=1 Tax=Cognatiyoonia koreensis TaxID=364200 RepID=A0A1I0P1Y3_9RHOB|nr:cytochrome c [Cognatiyoonia koreensis]SEW08367.1 Cytochrome c556 [Cognatiyoonia koreensis]
MRRLKTIGIATLSISLATAALADGHVTEDVAKAMNARNAHMQLYSFYLGPLSAMVKEEAPYDASVAGAAASNLAALAGMDQYGYWVEGSDASIEGSRAKAEIWTDGEGFAASQMALTEAAVALSSAAGTDLDALKAGFGNVGKACGACHEAYRAPRE